MSKSFDTDAARSDDPSGDLKYRKHNTPKAKSLPLHLLEQVFTLPRRRQQPRAFIRNKRRWSPLLDRHPSESVGKWKTCGNFSSSSHGLFVNSHGTRNASPSSPPSLLATPTFPYRRCPWYALPDAFLDECISHDQR
jgi:hypothetical protein